MRVREPCACAQRGSATPARWQARAYAAYVVAGSMRGGVRAGKGAAYAVRVRVAVVRAVRAAGAQRGGGTRTAGARVQVGRQQEA